MHRDSSNDEWVIALEDISYVITGDILEESKIFFKFWIVGSLILIVAGLLFWGAIKATESISDISEDTIGRIIFFLIVAWIIYEAMKNPDHAKAWLKEIISQFHKYGIRQFLVCWAVVFIVWLAFVFFPWWVAIPIWVGVIATLSSLARLAKKGRSNREKLQLEPTRPSQV